MKMMNGVRIFHTGHRAYVELQWKKKHGYPKKCIRFISNLCTEITGNKSHMIFIVDKFSLFSLLIDRTMFFWCSHSGWLALLKNYFSFTHILHIYILEYHWNIKIMSWKQLYVILIHLLKFIRCSFCSLSNTSQPVNKNRMLAFSA